MGRAALGGSDGLRAGLLLGLALPRFDALTPAGGVFLRPKRRGVASTWECKVMSPLWGPTLSGLKQRVQWSHPPLSSLSPEHPIRLARGCHGCRGAQHARLRPESAAIGGSGDADAFSPILLLRKSQRLPSFVGAGFKPALRWSDNCNAVAGARILSRTRKTLLIVIPAQAGIQEHSPCGACRNTLTCHHGEFLSRIRRPERVPHPGGHGHRRSRTAPDRCIRLLLAVGRDSVEPQVQ
jgi:hypothetical protein